MKRTKDIEFLIRDFQKSGMPAENIYLAGQGTGAWAPSLVARRGHVSFNAIIAFAPGFAGPKAGRSPGWLRVLREHEQFIARAEDQRFGLRLPQRSLRHDPRPEISQVGERNQYGRPSQRHHRQCRLPRREAPSHGLRRMLPQNPVAAHHRFHEPADLCWNLVSRATSPSANCAITPGPKRATAAGGYPAGGCHNNAVRRLPISLLVAFNGFSPPLVTIVFDLTGHAGHKI